MTDSGRRMKPHNTVRNRNTIFALTAVGIIILIGAAIGLHKGYRALADVRNVQTRIECTDTDVVVETGEMVPPEAIRFFFGLTNGATLAEIDFVEKRAAFLKKIPNVRDIRIERRLPNRVFITVEERRPIASLVPPGRNKRPDGRVTDAEGVVFQHRRSAAELPMIRDSAVAPSESGSTLKGMQAAAVELVDVLANRASTTLKVLDIDTSNVNYLSVTLGDYSIAKIAWERMGDGSKKSRASLDRQLKNLEEAIRTNLAPGTVLWNATNWKNNRIYASNPAATRSNDR